MKRVADGFEKEAERILALAIERRVNVLGGYGPGDEVIYEAHPTGCPSVVADHGASAAVNFMSNGSVSFTVTLKDGMEVNVLDGSFEAVQKREINALSANVWLAIHSGGQSLVASIVNPNINAGLKPERIKIVKPAFPERAMWYCAWFKPGRGASLAAAVRLGLELAPQGPALTRRIYLKNTGKALAGSVWTYFNLHGTQRFTYNKDLWYDIGLPLANGETITVCSLPYTDIMELKRVSSCARNAQATAATCDYTSFIGDTAAFAALPQAVLDDRMLDSGAGRKLSRFTVPSISATRFRWQLGAGRRAAIEQALLYVTDSAIIERFRNSAGCRRPAYADISRAFARAARELVAATPGAAQFAFANRVKAGAAGYPPFELQLPRAPTVATYANSVWTTVGELYEKCRAHGARLADGIELGTRDRGQDMWPEMKEDPGIVRRDLVYALGFMYRTTEKDERTGGRLTLPRKLHGMFPRQYPSRWDHREKSIATDNRPYADSPLWLLDALNMYIRETGDSGVLLEKTGSIRLVDPEHPETSGIIGGKDQYRVAEVVLETLECFARHADDSPYGTAQIMYGDWCDPVDMLGTSEVRNTRTKGRGRGTQIRLSAHLFLCLVESADLLETRAVADRLKQLRLGPRVARLKAFANQLRKNIISVAWESGPENFMAGFIDSIHELTSDGKTPRYAKGELGYTLGSMKGRDFDGVRRRVLTTQAYCLAMLTTRRDYLEDIAGSAEITRRLLKTIDELFYDKQLGLVLFTTPIANNRRAREYVGRMGIIPAGCAENGEYHHAQMFMHRFRLRLPGQADKVWAQFTPIISSTRDESIGGPFETPTTSYGADKADPHFGKGMYFGLSGSIDWMVEAFSEIAGLELALHDDSKPDVRVTPNLPAAIGETLLFRRIIHRHENGGYRRIPLAIAIKRRGAGRLLETAIRINGRRSPRAEIASLAGMQKLEIEIEYRRKK